MRRLGALAVVFSAAVGVAGGAFAAQSPTALRTAILAAGGAQRSVHYVSVQSLGLVRLQMVCDVAGGRGIQRIAFSKGSQSGRVTVLVVKRTAYVDGDAFALRNYMEFSSAEASRYANRWIAIPHTSSGYATVAAGVTLPSVIHLLYPKGRPTRVTGAAEGRPAVGVRVVGRARGSSYVETLWASRGGKPLPLEEDVAAKISRTRIAFNRWNEPVNVTAPAHAVPISTVRSG